MATLTQKLKPTHTLDPTGLVVLISYIRAPDAQQLFPSASTIQVSQHLTLQIQQQLGMALGLEIQFPPINYPGMDPDVIFDCVLDTRLANPFADVSGIYRSSL